MIFDVGQLNDLPALQQLGWQACIRAELALMKDLVPWLKKLAEGREILGLGVYE